MPKPQQESYNGPKESTIKVILIDNGKKEEIELKRKKNIQ